MSHISQEFVQRAAPDLPEIGARLGLIFGNQNRAVVYDMVCHAARLYHSRHLRKIIVTGGVPFEDRRDIVSEARYACNILMSRGVPRAHILVENKSTNSRENVINARRLVRQAEGILRREPILCMGREYATSRFLMTMAANWPEATPGFIGFDNFSRAKKDWHHCPDISALIRRDIEKWPVYQARGHIKPVNLRHLNWKLHAANKPRKVRS